MNFNELCRVLSATLHVPGVERWAEQLVSRELLPGLDHKVYALDAALLLMAVVADPSPADAPRVVVALANLPRMSTRRCVGGRDCRANFRFRRLTSHPVDKSTGLRCDQIVVPTGVRPALSYPDKLRRIAYRDPETGQRLTFLTNNFTLPPLTIARLYKCRWQVELFFKWIKQHRRIKRFFGNTENAVKTQLWIAISVYVLVAIIKKRLEIDASLSTQSCRF